MLPLIAGGVLFASQIRILTDEVMAANIALMDKVGEDIEQEIMGLLESGTTLSQNANLRKYLLLQPPITEPKDRLITVEIINALSSIAHRSAIADTLYLYARNMDTVLTPTGLYDSQLFYQYSYGLVDVPYDAFKKQLMEMPYQYFDVDTVTIRLYDKDTPCIAITQTLPKDNRLSAQGIFVATIRQDSILKRFEKVYPYGQYAILDGDNCFLAASEGFQGQEQWPLTDASGYFTPKDNPQDDMVFYTKIQALNWRLVAAIPRASVLGQIEASHRIFYVLYSVCLIIGGLLVWLVSRWQYTPIARIVNSLQAYEPPQTRTGEYEYIHSMVKRMLEQNKELAFNVEKTQAENKRVSELISQSQRQIQASLLISLLRGTIMDINNTVNWLNLYGIHFPHRYFQVALLAPPQDVFIKEEDAYLFNQQVRLIIDGMIETPLENTLACYVIQPDKAIHAIIINACETISLDQIQQLSHAIIQKIKLITQKETGVSVNYALSDVYGEVFSLAQAYKGVYNALTTKSMLHEDTVEASYVLTFKSYRKKLGQLMRAGQIEDSKAYILEVYNACEPQDYFTFLIQSSYLLIQLLDSLHEDHNGTFFQDSVISAMINQKGDTLIRGLLALAEKTHQQLQKKQEQATKSQGELIRQYIEEHLTDPDLSQTVIADHFELSQSNISKIFKREWSINMIDYINQARVVLSLRLLRETNLSLPEIAQQVGFTNSHTLMRVFKKYEDMTPSQYRVMRQDSHYVSQNEKKEGNTHDQ